MIELYDMSTGEIKKVENAFLVCPFRTRYNNPQSFSDAEDYTDVPSQTDASQYEPIESIIKRIERGEVVHMKDGLYENDGDVGMEEAFDRLDPTTTPGFDLSDAYEISQALNEKESESVKKDLPTSADEAEKIYKKADSAVVDKSVSQDTDQ